MSSRTPDWSRHNLERDGPQYYPRPVEFIKLFSLICVIVICGVSFFYDPFAPTNSGPAGFLGIRIDFGINLKDQCQHIDNHFKNCQKSSPSDEDRDRQSSWVGYFFGEKANEIDSTNDWFKVFRQASETANKNKLVNLGQGSSLTDCNEFKKELDECRAVARSTIEMIRLKCYDEVKLIFRFIIFQFKYGVS